MAKKKPYCMNDDLILHSMGNPCEECQKLHADKNAKLYPEQVEMYADTLTERISRKPALVLIALTEQWLAPTQITNKYMSTDANGNKPQGSAFVSDPLKKLMAFGLAEKHPGGKAQYCITPKGRQVKDYLYQNLVL